MMSEAELVLMEQERPNASEPRDTREASAPNSGAFTLVPPAPGVPETRN
jgi:hypothetical protein